MTGGSLLGGLRGVLSRKRWGGGLGDSARGRFTGDAGLGDSGSGRLAGGEGGG